MEPSKIATILNWPTPVNVKLLRGFLGITGYYPRFIHHYANLAHPLTELLKKENFHWPTEAQLAFEKLKSVMVTAPVLQLPDFSKPFVLETDASGIGIGAILSQQSHPIAYFSKKLTPRMQQQLAYVR